MATKQPVVYTADMDGKTQTYEGFSKPYIKTNSTPKVLIVATGHGEVDLWRADPNTPLAHVLEELRRMYRADGHKDEDTDIRVYHRDEKYDPK